MLLLEMMPQWTVVHMYVVELVLLFSSGGYPEVKWLDHRAVLFLIFEAPLHISPQHLHQFTLPPGGHKGSTPLPMFLFVVFDNNHSDSGGVMSHCGFDVPFPPDE